jgi:hypothetical protein
MFQLVEPRCELHVILLELETDHSILNPLPTRGWGLDMLVTRRAQRAPILRQLSTLAFLLCYIALCADIVSDL